MRGLSLPRKGSGYRRSLVLKNTTDENCPERLWKAEKLIIGRKMFEPVLHPPKILNFECRLKLTQHLVNERDRFLHLSLCIA